MARFPARKKAALRLRELPQSLPTCLGVGAAGLRSGSPEPVTVRLLRDGNLGPNWMNPLNDFVTRRARLPGSSGRRRPASRGDRRGRRLRQVGLVCKFAAPARPTRLMASRRVAAANGERRRSATRVVPFSPTPCAAVSTIQTGAWPKLQRRRKAPRPRAELEAPGAPVFDARRTGRILQRNFGGHKYPRPWRTSGTHRPRDDPNPARACDPPVHRRPPGSPGLELFTERPPGTISGAVPPSTAKRGRFQSLQVQGRSFAREGGIALGVSPSRAQLGVTGRTGPRGALRLRGGALSSCTWNSPVPNPTGMIWAAVRGGGNPGLDARACAAEAGSCSKTRTAARPLFQWFPEAISRKLHNKSLDPGRQTRRGWR